MNMIVLVLMMAVTVEALVEYAKTFGKAILEKQWKTAATQAGAVALGVLLCFGVGADFYAALGVNFSVAWLGIALTGVFASRGANYVSDLVKKLQALGAAQVLITDISTPRLELAKACGVDFAVNTKEHGFGEALAECFGPDKADVIYDCAGNDTTMGQAIRHARKGSTIILVAVYAGMANVDLAVLNDHELDLNTSMMYRHEDYLEAIRLVNEGKVRLEPLMSRHFPFRDYLAAYRYIDANRETTMKVLIDVDESEA